MIYVIKFMAHSLIAISVIVPIAGIIAWSWSDKKTDFKDWIKNF